MSISESGKHRLFCIAASMGGIEAISAVISVLPRDFPGSLFIVQHIQDTGTQCYLADIFNSRSALDCRLADRPLEIASGTAYIAAPGTHMIVDRDRVFPTLGPRENYSRPAADPTFRSVAAQFRSSVVGIILSGMLDDGTAGLLAVKQCGGKAIAQDPKTAIAPDMPQSAIDHCEVDFVLPVERIGQQMIDLTISLCGPSHDPTHVILEELKFAKAVKSDVPAEEQIGDLSPFMCPDCGGQMWQVNDQSIPRFRCHVGHAHTLKSLVSQHGDSVERLGWALLRSLKERELLLKAMAKHERQLNRPENASHYRNMSEQCRSQAELVQTTLKLIPTDVIATQTVGT